MEGEANCDKNPGSWGEFLPTESVQALAVSEDLTEIPHRYIRPNVEADFLGVDSDEEIPIVDLHPLTMKFPSSNLDAKSGIFSGVFEDRIARSLLVTLHEKKKDASPSVVLLVENYFSVSSTARVHDTDSRTHICKLLQRMIYNSKLEKDQLINHGVPAEVIERMKTDVEEFFALSLEEKKAYAQLPGGLDGYGQQFVISEGQKLDWSDCLYFFTQPINLRKMRFWPTQPPTFRDTLDKYIEELNKVADCLLRLLAKNLGLHSEELNNLYQSGVKSLRINYYPPCPQAHKVLGISPHSDMTGITLLLQFSDVQGLQIKRHGRWLPIKPVPGAFTVNIGDILEIMTNGRYKSIEHRAVVNPNEKRISLALFYDPHVDSMVGPLPKLAAGREYYKTLSYESYIRMVLSTTIDGNTLAQMKLQK